MNYNNLFQVMLVDVLRLLFLKCILSYACNVQLNILYRAYQISSTVIQFSNIQYFNKCKICFQERFLLTKGSRDSTLWWIPLSYTTKTDKDFHDAQPRLWLNNKQHKNNIGDIPSTDWLLVNINQTGMNLYFLRRLAFV